MDYKIILDILTAAGTVGAVIVAMVAIYNANKSSQQQIRTAKLEELYEVINSLSGYYSKFVVLQFKIASLRQKETHPFEWLAFYSEERDILLPEIDRKLIASYLSRIEVLANCYTTGDLQASIMDYQDLLYWFSDLVFNGSSMNDIIDDKRIFPRQPEFIVWAGGIKAGILKEIKS